MQETLFPPKNTEVARESRQKRLTYRKWCFLGTLYDSGDLTWSFPAQRLWNKQIEPARGLEPQKVVHYRKLLCSHGSEILLLYPEALTELEEATTSLSH